eukprot:15448428-Alexandrium_andersonii.AAC.1
MRLRIVSWLARYSLRSSCLGATSPSARPRDRGLPCAALRPRPRDLHAHATPATPSTSSSSFGLAWHSLLRCAHDA